MKEVMDDYIVLLTGSNGFLGTSLKAFLSCKCIKIETFSLRTQNDIADLEIKLRNSGEKYIILNAGWSGVKIGSLDKEIQQFNLEYQKLLINVARFPSVIRFINFGSYNEYGSTKGILKEGMKDLNPVSEYAKAKNELRTYIEESAYFDKFLHLRIANIYGPGQPSNSLYTTLLMYKNKPLSLGAGNALRDMLYIDDFCNALLLIIKSKINGILNIGSGISLTNREFVLKTSETLNIPLNHLCFNEDRRDNVFMSEDFTLNVEKAHKLLGWKAIGPFKITNS